VRGVEDRERMRSGDPVHGLKFFACKIFVSDQLLSRCRRRKSIPKR
jgi:hypothetical protein